MSTVGSQFFGFELKSASHNIPGVGAEPMFGCGHSRKGASCHHHRNAGFIRQAGGPHWGCRMNPAFRLAGPPALVVVSGWGTAGRLWNVFVDITQSMWSNILELT